MNIVFRSLKLTLLCLCVNSGYSSHLIKFGDWFNISSFVERINTRTQGVVIDINDNGNYNVFEVNNRRCFFETIRGDYNPGSGSGVDFTRYFHVDSAHSSRSRNSLTLNGFHGFNTAYTLEVTSKNSS